MRLQMNKHSIYTCVALMSCIANVALAEARYQITELGTLGGNSFSQSINKRGQVTGYSFLRPNDSTRHAFNWKPKKNLKDIGTLGGQTSFGLDINNKFQIIGASYITESSSLDSSKIITSSRAFFWTSTKGMVSLGTLGGSNSYGYGLNEKREAVGYSDIAGGIEKRAFFWSKQKGMVDLGTLGGTTSYGYGINKFGYVTGSSSMPGDTSFHAFIMKPLSRNPSKILIDIGTLGGDFSRGLSLNDLAQVTGTSNVAIGDTQNNHAFIWSELQGMLDLGTLGGKSSYGYDINNAGVVTGASQFDETQDTHGFVWTKATGIEDLNDLIPPDSGWTITRGNGINDKGQIAAQGFNTSNEVRALVLTPIKR